MLETFYRHLFNDIKCKSSKKVVLVKLSAFLSTISIEYVISLPLKAKVIKESRIVPNLIYAIEQYERYLILLTKKSKVCLSLPDI